MINPFPRAQEKDLFKDSVKNSHKKDKIFYDSNNSFKTKIKNFKGKRSKLLCLERAHQTQKEDSSHCSEVRRIR